MHMDSQGSYLRNPEFLQIQDQIEGVLYGCNQLWYPSYWQRLSGCGPSTASNLVLYFQRKGIIKERVPVTDKTSFIGLMEQIWQFITPAAGGVHLLSQFYLGFSHYLESIGSSLSYKALEIPKKKELRPTLEQVVGFIEDALAQDSPVAFLNLSRGTLKNLDEWHWVTIVGLRKEEASLRWFATIYDANKTWEIDISQWYETNKRGGGLISYLASE
ncbi:hypothetical protein [uncultured Sphaerochaeta sp.]|uniref:hypothetical protein n=1 Tax=uncultured Sphaerochaeta sp. TaxID=886478 RepID=UPI002A0A20E8|nr:hypothetical protein [uncultured Sphaerochaeta sp.]